jgi:anthranilate phosphoribosyltransferase
MPETIMDLQTAIRRVVDGHDLDGDQMIAVMRAVMTGEATPAQIGAFIVALRMKGESITEIGAAAAVMRGLVTRVEVDKQYLVDTCGTGGDAAGTFNISTAGAFVAAAAGARVAKHGNRSVSSNSGSADVLEAAGVNLQLTPEQVGRCIDEVGVGFMFAPAHHRAMKHAIGPRREIGVRTLFNLLGPLTNPAGAPNQLLGVFSTDWVEPLARVLQQLGSEHVMVVSAVDGLDEISIGGATLVSELAGGEVRTYEIEPEEFGFQRVGIEALAVDGVEQSLAMMRSVLDNEPGPAHDIVELNAGAAIFTSGVADTLEEGISYAAEALCSGKAKARLDALVKLSNSLGE